ncbi:MAG: beta-galactosidase [Selenomonadaceae bacterium]|nr:beta-galactosidase [Selenomonadaceae bacterium]
MRIGLVYYPEHWDTSMWENDARLIMEAGCDTVRMGEFAWSKMEPHEGQFDFDWLDEVCQILNSKGIKTILCTPTAAPPKWLMDRYPDIYPEDEYGHRRGFGARRHYCYNSYVYRLYSEKITTEMAKFFKNKPYVAAWQIDNEFGCGDGAICYCENCRRAFIRWLQNRYINLEDVNEHWGSVFWSQTYTEWEQIITPKITATSVMGNSGHNPSFLVDYRRFMADSVADYCRLQYRILKKYYPDTPVTHNFAGESYDYALLKDYVDVASFDNHVYLPWGEASADKVSFNHALCRSIKGENYWIVEHQFSQGGWDHYGSTLKPGIPKMLTYQSLANGCEWIVYWRLRSCRYSTEQYWIGVIDHDNVPRRRFHELQVLTAELPTIMKYSDGSMIKSEIMLLRSFEQKLCHQYQRNNIRFDYDNLLQAYYGALFKENYNLDIGREDSDFSRYKVVLIPAYAMQKDGFQEKVEKYVSQGGTVVLTFRSGYKEWDNRMSDQTIPGIFRTVAGVEVWESDSLCFGRMVSIEGQYNGIADTWCDILKPITAETISTYASEFYKGLPAITINYFGKGRVYYIGCNLKEDALRILLREIVKEAGVQPALRGAPEGVEGIRKDKDGQELLFVINHNEEEVDVELGDDYIEMLSSASMHCIHLGPFGAAGLYKTRR